MERRGRKFVSPIEPLALKWLSLIEFSDEESNRTKLRAQAIRLSNSGYSINQISQICLTTQETVSKWIDGWEKYQFDSLVDKPRPNAVSLAAWLIVQIKTFSFGTVFSRILSARPYTFCALDKYCPDLFNIRKQQIVCTIEQ